MSLTLDNRADGNSASAEPRFQCRCRKHLRDFLAVFLFTVPGPRVFVHDFSLFSRFSLSHWDAMLLAACKEAGVTTLYSEDMDPGTDYDGLTIINPFA